VIRRGPGLLGTMARTAVVAGTASATVNAMNRRSNQRAVEQEQAAAYRADQQSAAYQAAPQPASPAPAAAGGGDDLVSQLTELARLRDGGVLTPEEFDAAKAKLLG
jgi:Short C-terminal domain